MFVVASVVNLDFCLVFFLLALDGDDVIRGKAKSCSDAPAMAHSYSVAKISAPQGPSLAS
jgi:hypothetical protein